MIEFQMGTEGRRVKIACAVLDVFERHRHRRPFQFEAGGGLFMAEDRNDYVLVEATGPSRLDIRTPVTFSPCSTALNRVVRTRRKQGRFFVGLWHTHAEDRPNPSSRDFDGIQRLFKNNRHDLNAMLMIIVGRDPFPDGLWVSMHNMEGWEKVILTQRTE